jgi:hypothetical protein
MSGARRRALAGDEPSKAAVSSLPFVGSEGASEAQPGRQSPRAWVAGSRPRCRESGTERALVDGRRSGPGKLLSFDGAVAEAVLAGFQRVSARRESVTGDARGRFALLVCGRKSRGEGASRGGSFDRRHPPGTRGARALVERRGISCASLPKLGAHRQMRSHSSRVLGHCPVTRDRRAQVRRSPRESNVRQVLVSRIGCRSR